MISASEWNRIRYSAWAPFYDVVVRMLRDKRRRSLEVAQLKPGERVLLLGAGTGLDLELIGLGPCLTAIDISPAMVKRLRERAKRLGRDVDIRVMDAQYLEFPDDSFDVVILHFVLAVIPDPIRAIREVTRVLRPSGRVLVLNKFVPDHKKPQVVMRMLNPIVRVIATDLTCKLGPIVAASGLHVAYEEPSGFGGFFKIALLRKGKEAPPAPGQRTVKMHFPPAVPKALGIQTEPAAAEQLLL